MDRGFVAELKGDVTPAPARIRIDVRYLVRKGRPKYRKADFDLNSPAVKIAVKAGVHAKIDRASVPGSLVLSEIEPGFKMQVTGFDPNRDLYVHAEPEFADVP